jgi:predicted regulator of Ras-like GTPase activity (Roadblock/LC7/MglB family)
LQINSLSDNPKHRVKQQKVASVPPPAPQPAPPQGPRYRYFSTTPETVTLRMRDLQIPEKARTPGYNSEQFIDLPCSDIFRGATPKILLSRLAELAPDSVTAKDLPDQGVKVCSSRLALAYVVTERRERLTESSAPEAAPVVVPPLEEFAPPKPAAEKTSEPAPESKKSDPIPADVPEPAPAAKAPEDPSKDEKKPLIEIPKPKAPADTKAIEPEPKAPIIPTPTAKLPTPVLPPIASPVAKPAPDEVPAAEISEKKAEPEPEPAAPAPAPAPAKKPFSLFPMFRRKEATDIKPSVIVPRGRIEIPKPKRPPSPFTDASTEEKPEAATEPKPEAELKEFKPPIPKPRFEPSKSFEPKLVPTTPATPPEAALPSKDLEDLPSTPKSGTAPEAFAPPQTSEAPAPVEPVSTPAVDPVPADNSVEGEAPKMPELPSFAPKPPPRYIQRLRAAEAAAKKSSVPAPFPVVKPGALVSDNPAGDAPIEAEQKPEPIAVPPVEEPALPPLPAPEAAILPPLEPPTVKIEPPIAKVEEIKLPEPAIPSEEKIEDAPKPPPAMLEVPPPAAAPAAPAVLVETEHVAPKDAPPEIAEQDALQAIFLTEEFLSVDRVLELCGNLPGIHSCVLSQGASVIASHNAPDTVDVVSLSAHALEMLKAMRSSSSKMGIGAVPAVTVHSEKGPITFFHQDDICLLVLHKDRGFIPGVREKLQHVVDELSKAKLPLRLGGGDAKKLPGK